MKKLKFIILLIALSFTVSCREEATELMDPNLAVMPSNLSEQFKAIWNGINNSYVFWDIDTVNWNKMYKKYLPIFEELDKKEFVKTREIENLYKEICGSLIDHHMAIEIVNLKRSEDDQKIAAVHPGWDEVMNRDYYHDPFTHEQLLANLRKMQEAGRISNFVTGTSKDDDGTENAVCSCVIDDGIVYLRLTGFIITGLIGKNDLTEDEQQILKAVTNYKKLILTLPGIKGIILDIRNNLGGYLDDFHQLLCPLLDSDLLIGYSRAKQGLGRLDYSEWIPFVLPPAKEHRKPDIPIVALTDITSVSMAEVTAIAVSALPNGCVIGERTFGATGSLDGFFPITYAGTFGDIEKTGYSAYISTMMLKDTHGTVYEGAGITPDIQVQYDAEAMESGRDVQFEHALQYIKTH